ncbi:MAG: cytochrome c biogenesis protein CcsA [Planctomycetota bacterium]
MTPMLKGQEEVETGSATSPARGSLAAAGRVWGGVGSKLAVPFLLHALVALGALLLLNWMIALYVPLSIHRIEQSYLIFFYHFPAAQSCFVMFTIVMVCSIAVLRTDGVAWDRRARVAGEVGLVACSVVLATGSTWASAAWNTWWVWEDPRLMSAAVMWLTYAGYVLLQSQMEDPAKRRRFAAVFGILAYLNIPLVILSIRLAGEVTSHPMAFDDFTSDERIVLTRWYGVLAFLLFYLLIFRWKLAREAVRERLEGCLSEVRRLEERVVT